jgi:hypothetical protein
VITPKITVLKILVIAVDHHLENQAERQIVVGKLRMIKNVSNMGN